MPQPIKKSGPFQKPRSKTVRKPARPAASGEKRDRRLPPKHKNVVRRKPVKRNHPEYGTSKLEERFAREYLDKLGIEYVYQYKAESIGRYYDFLLKGNEKHPTKICFLEIDGQYFHADPRIYEEKDLNAMQKKNRRVDEIKNRYCSMNGYPLIRISEYDLNHEPDKVLRWLKEKLKDFIRKNED